MNKSDMAKRTTSSTLQVNQPYMYFSAVITHPNGNSQVMSFHSLLLNLKNVDFKYLLIPLMKLLSYCSNSEFTSGRCELHTMLWLWNRNHKIRFRLLILFFDSLVKSRTPCTKYSHWNKVSHFYVIILI